MPLAYNNGVSIHYELHGEGEPLVLLHGFTSSLERWKLCGYVDALKDRYRLILIDLRGHGSSAKPHGRDDYALEQRLGDIRAVLDALQIARTHFLGYSMGGWLAFGMAVHHPGMVHSLIIGGAHPYAESLSSFAGLDGSNADAFIAAHERFIGESVSAQVRPLILQNDLMALCAAAQDRAGFASRLADIRAPLMLFVGDGDARHGKVQRCAGEIGNAQVVVVPGGTHVSTLFASRLLLPAITAFLEQQAMHA